MSKIKLVMSDLDDTLLKDNSYVSEKDREMLNRLIDEGVSVIPTTGRYHGGIPEYFFEHPGIRYLVSSNGAQIFDKVKNEVLFTSYLSKDIALDIVSQALDKAVFIGVVVEHGLVVDARIRNDKERKNSAFFTRIIESEGIVDDILEYIKETDEKILKINLAFKDLEYRDKLYETLKQNDEIMAEASSIRNVEITQANTSKGAALEYMLEYLGLDVSEVLAIGDNDNDITMLQKAGVGVAMGNASEHVKSHSDTVTLDVEDDGFAHAIRTHFKY